MKLTLGSTYKSVPIWTLVWYYGCSAWKTILDFKIETIDSTFSFSAISKHCFMLVYFKIKDFKSIHSQFIEYFKKMSN